jgi:hydrogenase small subunit
VKLGCKGPVVKCNVPIRGWVNGIGGCPNVGGICMACTMPGFPDKYMPFMEPNRWGVAAENIMRFTYGPIVRTFRKRHIKNQYDVEPEWRHNKPELTTGYSKRW